jgi:hypothetical protein
MQWVVTNTEDTVGISLAYLHIMTPITLFMDSCDQAPLHINEDGRQQIVHILVPQTYTTGQGQFH